MANLLKVSPYPPPPLLNKQRVYLLTSKLGNPSGGNKLRGLYNISLKSLGASVKRNPDVSWSSIS